MTKWNQIPGNSGGSSATIAAMLPQSGSGIRTVFLSALGLTAPGLRDGSLGSRDIGADGLVHDDALQGEMLPGARREIKLASSRLPFGRGH